MASINSIMGIAASGMLAQQLNLDNVSNNIANANSAGYRKTRTEFVDIVDAGQTAGPQAMMAVAGVDVSAVHRLFTPGTIVPTGQPLDVAISGEGYFQVQMPDGSTGYTRDGSLTLDAEGRLVTSRGLVLMPELTITDSPDSITIDSDGRILAQVGEDVAEIGQLTLVRFPNPAGLEAIGDNCYRETVASGAPAVGAPATEGRGEIIPNALEMSNVDIGEEMLNLITAQRAYQMNSRAFQIADEMLGIANQIRG